MSRGHKHELAALYADRIMSAEDACARSARTRAVLTGNCSVPPGPGALAALRQPDQRRDRAGTHHRPAEYVAPEMTGHIRVNTLFISDNVRRPSTKDARTSRVLPIRGPRLFKSGRSRSISPSSRSPAGRARFCSFGVESRHQVRRQSARRSSRRSTPTCRARWRLVHSCLEAHHHRTVDYKLPESHMGATDEITERIADTSPA